MPSSYTLDDNIMEYLFEIDKTIKSRKYWTSETYESVFKSLQVATAMVEKSYLRLTGTTLKETSRRLFEDVQGGGIETFINHYNAFLFIRKLQNKIREHQCMGCFLD